MSACRKCTAPLRRGRSTWGSERGDISSHVSDVQTALHGDRSGPPSSVTSDLCSRKRMLPGPFSRRRRGLPSSSSGGSRSRRAQHHSLLTAYRSLATRSQPPRCGGCAGAGASAHRRPNCRHPLPPAARVPLLLQRCSPKCRMRSNARQHVKLFNPEREEAGTRVGGGVSAERCGGLHEDRGISTTAEATVRAAMTTRRMAVGLTVCA